MHVDYNIIISHANEEECVPRISVCPNTCRTNCDIRNSKTSNGRKKVNVTERHKHSQNQKHQ
jgi:hypothetical protein